MIQHDIKQAYKILKFASYVYWLATLSQYVISDHSKHTISHTAQLLTFQSIFEFMDIFFVASHERYGILVHHAFMSSYLALWYLAFNNTDIYICRATVWVFVVQIMPIMLFRACVHQNRWILNFNHKNALMFAQVFVPGLLGPVVVLLNTSWSVVFPTCVALITCMITLFFEIAVFLKNKWGIELLYTHVDRVTNDIVISPVLDYS